MISNTLAYEEHIHHFKDKYEVLKKDFKWNWFYKGYVYSFPVHKYNNKPTLECKFIIYPNENYENVLCNKVQIEVFDLNSDNFYAPFYNYDKCYLEFIDSINKIIRNQMKKLRISNNKNKDNKLRKIKKDINAKNKTNTTRIKKQKFQSSHT